MFDLKGFQNLDTKFFIFMAIALVITVAVEVPIDNQIKTWTIETLPENWTALRSRWSQFHTLRTFISILGFVSLSVAVVMSSGFGTRFTVSYYLSKLTRHKVHFTPT